MNATEANALSPGNIFNTSTYLKDKFLYATLKQGNHSQIFEYCVHGLLEISDACKGRNVEVFGLGYS